LHYVLITIDQVVGVAENEFLSLFVHPMTQSHGPSKPCRWGKEEGGGRNECKKLAASQGD
jgi:hypothetical protein